MNRRASVLFDASDFEVTRASQLRYYARCMAALRQAMRVFEQLQGSRTPAENGMAAAQLTWLASQCDQAATVLARMDAFWNACVGGWAPPS